MFSIRGKQYRSCDGISRRDLLKVGALSLGGLGLADWMRLSAQADPSQRKDLSVILLWQGGGPSHLDMWDLKPEAPSEFRGTFNPIPSAVPGYQVSEHLPYSARVVDRLAILRSVSHPDSGHQSASHMLLTGYKPTNDIPFNEVPSYGSIVSHELGSKNAGFPAYVTLPHSGPGMAASYLGVAYNPFETLGDPSSDSFSVRNLKLPNGLSIEQLDHRMTMLKQFDRMRRDTDASGLIAGMDAFTQQAWNLVTSPAVQEAFNIGQEDTKLRDRYGRHDWGQNMLLGRRLVEAGVRFVTVDIGGWDSHANNFEVLKQRLLPKFDQSFATLIEDLDQRGRLDNTLVLVWGEFGRTPRINANSGRDHWSNVMSVVMAGGGLKRGIVLGESDPRAEFPKERPLTPQDVLATMYHLLGIDRHKTFSNDASRPVEILNYGEPIHDILA
jgi:Protein of unknown function (DUF1501)